MQKNFWNHKLSLEKQTDNVKAKLHWKKQLLFVIKTASICQKLNSKKMHVQHFLKMGIFSTTETNLIQRKSSTKWHNFLVYSRLSLWHKLLYIVVCFLWVFIFQEYLLRLYVLQRFLDFCRLQYDENPALFWFLTW